MNKVLSLSGGLDSGTLLYDLVDQHGVDKIFPITFDYGQKNDIEVDYASNLCLQLGVKHKVVDIGFLGEMCKDVCSLSADSDIAVPDITEVLGDPQPTTYVGYRNFIMLGIAMCYAEAVKADEVYISLQPHDIFNYWDTSVEFIEAVNNVSMLNRKNAISIKAPYVDKTKADEIKIGLRLGLDYADTWTCYDPQIDLDDECNLLACGVCSSCSDRIQHFMKLGLIDPAEYSVEIDWKDCKKCVV